MKMLKYKPFRGIQGFSLEKDDFDVPKFLHFKTDHNDNFSLQIRENGYVPKSGLIICNSMQGYIFGKKILEIGTGETAIVSIYCSKKGSGKITAVDIDKDAVDWAKMNCKINKINNVNIFASNIYEKVKGKYDIIVSNPPQLPNMDSANPHDFGGEDGRTILEKIITDSPRYLNKNGCLFLLAFDFLSVDKKFGKKESLFELLKKNGFRPTIICSKTHIIRKDGKTYQAMNKIRRLSPKFTFIKNSKDDLTHKILIVKAVKKD